MIGDINLNVYVCFTYIFIFKILATQSTLSSNYPFDVVLETDSCKCAKGAFQDCSPDCCAKQEETIVGCYFTNWARYRSGIAQFTPENINISLCTHIFYAFASLDESLLISMSDSWADDSLGAYEQVVTLGEENNIPVILSIGGWNNSNYTLWNAMMVNETNRKLFIGSVLTFLEKYKFDGLDMDYEYPGCPQGNSSLALESSKYDFNQLMKEMKVEMKGKYILTVATAAGKEKVETCYDMEALCGIVDWVNLMTYEYHSYADGEIGAQAPVCNTNQTWGIYHSIKYFLRVCPAHKIVLGLPFYGQSFTMENTHPAKFGVTASGAGTAGKYTLNPSTLAYYEICSLVIDGYNQGYSKVNGSYAFNYTQFISYDSPMDIKRKSCLIKNFGLRGAYVWALDYDDFNNVCGCGSYPLLKLLNQELRCLNTTACIDCY